MGGRWAEGGRKVDGRWANKFVRRWTTTSGSIITSGFVYVTVCSNISLFSWACFVYSIAAVSLVVIRPCFLFLSLFFNTRNTQDVL